MAQVAKPDGTGITGGLYVKLSNGQYEPVIDASGNIVGDIADTLAEGSIYVGNSSNVTSELDASGDTKFLIGNGTTIASFAFSGDVTVTNGGVATVAALDLETATVTNIVDTELMIGTGAGTANFAVVSGDATLANTGALTVVSAAATWGTPGTTTTSGAGAVAITGAIHEVTTTGTGDALTLIDGAEGQHLHVVYVAEGAGGDTAILTPTNLAGANTTVTFTDLGDSAHLLFTAGTWFFLGGEATVG